MRRAARRAARQAARRAVHPAARRAARRERTGLRARLRAGLLLRERTGLTLLRVRAGLTLLRVRAGLPGVALRLLSRLGIFATASGGADAGHEDDGKRERKARSSHSRAPWLQSCGSGREHSSEPDTGVKGNVGRKGQPFSRLIDRSTRHAGLDVAVSKTFARGWRSQRAEGAVLTCPWRARARPHRDRSRRSSTCSPDPWGSRLSRDRGCARSVRS